MLIRLLIQHVLNMPDLQLLLIFGRLMFTHSLTFTCKFCQTKERTIAEQPLSVTLGDTGDTSEEQRKKSNHFEYFSYRFIHRLSKNIPLYNYPYRTCQSSKDHRSRYCLSIFPYPVL